LFCVKRVIIYLTHPTKKAKKKRRDRAEVSEGYVLVPIKPTKKMLDAAWAAAHEEDAAEVWAEMIAASQLPE